MFPLGRAASFVAPFLRYALSGKTTPALAGYKITHRCNLRCAHCPYWSRKGEESDFARATETLRRLKDLGVRILIFEGGEPLLWRDGKKTIGHLVEYARGLFRSVCLTTNGLTSWSDLPIERVWVSLDGPRELHDRIRGPGVYDKVMRNIEAAGTGVFLSTTVNTLNIESIPGMLAALPPAVHGITVQFHYPYGGLPDPLYVDGRRRAAFLETLADLKRNGARVANSFACLKDMRRVRWTCHDGFLANAEPDGKITVGCYLKNRAESMCERCGFSAHNELSLAFDGKVESIITGLRIFFR
jgi:MoaA/NifB/PqqE/SkfB family radical SAM enzyme